MHFMIDFENVFGDCEMLRREAPYQRFPYRAMQGAWPGLLRGAIHQTDRIRIQRAINFQFRELAVALSSSCHY